MNPTLRSLGFVLAVTTAAGAASAQATPEFELRIMAFTGMTTGDGVVLSDIDTQLSINDRGEIAFTGIDAGGSKAFAIRNGVAKGITFFSAPRVFNGAAINNELPVAKVATRDRFAGSPPIFFERKWPVDGSQAFTMVGESPDDFDSGLLFVDINDSGVMAFSGLTAGAALTALFAGSTQPPTTLVSFPGVQSIRPQISNGNLVVCRDHLARIRAFPFPAGSPITIADSAGGFTATGRQPGISPDGRAIAFMGNRGNGEGIFGAFLGSSGYSVFLIAGEGGNGFTDFVDDDRAGVISSGDAISGNQNASFVFQGTRNGQAGVYQVDVFAAEVGGSVVIVPSAVRTVATIGGAVSTTFHPQSGGTQTVAKTIASLALYDPFARTGTLAFHAGFSDGSEGILKADGDRDGDGLLDRWETVGIDVDLDGVVDLDLGALGADPDHKDVFVEADAMVGRVPAQATLDRVVLAFSLAPKALVQNPDGQDGIALHVQLDETDLTLAPFPSPWAEFDAFKAGQFGTDAERASPSAAKILAAKRLAFRYCIFADTILSSSISGIAELPGNDFIVSLGAFATPGGTPDQQAATFMHEMGHTLGLHHGGSDDINHKPNYHSSMSYTWQLPKAWLPDWGLNYSVAAFPALDENNLNEANGIGGTAGVLTWIGPPGGAGNGRTVDEANPVDWDADGTPGEAGIVLDITQVATGKPAGLDALASHVDWSALEYNFRDTADFADGDHASALNVIEIDAQEHEADAARCIGPATYCTAKPNSLGCAPTISSTGSTSLTGPDDFVVRVDQVLNQRRGVLLWSKSKVVMAFGGGFLCVQGPQLRALPIGNAGGSQLPANDCSGSYAAAFTHAYMASKGILAGDMVFVQCWSRDNGFGEPDNIGLSAGLAFYVCP